MEFLRKVYPYLLVILSVIFIALAIRVHFKHNKYVFHDDDGNDNDDLVTVDDHATAQDQNPPLEDSVTLTSSETSEVNQVVEHALKPHHKKVINKFFSHHPPS